MIAIENARLFSEKKEALERQTATSDILRVISQSPTEVQPVFDAIVATAVRLFRRDRSFILRTDGARFWQVAFAGPDGVLPFPDLPPEPIDPDANFPSRAIVTRQNLHLSDWSAIELPDFERQIRDTFGFNSALYLPLLRDGECIGVLGIAGTRAGQFDDNEIALAESFRDQALIAIENARLFNETEDALARQTATSEILRVISQSPTDAQPVFDVIAQTAIRLLGCNRAFIQRCDEECFWTVTWWGAEGRLPLINMPRVKIDPAANFPSRAIVQKQTVHLPDWSLIELPLHERMIQKRLGLQTALFMPLLRDNKCIGLLSVAGTRPNMFGDNEIALAESFRDQALIAIENVRLFDEVQAKARDLTESLQQQTATADVLKVISRSAFDLQTVLVTLTRSAVELSGAQNGIIFLRDGDLFRYRASSHADSNPEWVKWLEENPQKAGRNTATARAITTGRIACVADVPADPEVDLPATPLAGIRAALSVPLLRDGKVEGVMTLTRQVPGPFTDRQIELVQTFADQAVIAIENARLFDEVQAKTRDLTEALTYQTGSANILNVIAASPTDVAPVLKAIVESACEVCEAYDAAVVLRDGNDLRFSAHHGPIPIGLEKWPINRRWTAGRAFIDQQPVHIADLRDERHADFSDGRDLSLRMGHRTIVSVPLLRDKESIGAIVLRRNEVHPFSDKQIALLQTFADQAVIALGNVRLFEEVQAKTRELEQSLEDLRTAQDRLVQTEKLASLGQLTAGIAHEIKNPLNFVNNFSALSAELVDELNEALESAALPAASRGEIGELTGLLKDNLHKVVQHGKRADSIVKNMLLHSREGSGEHRPTNINALVEESLTLAYHGARAERPDFNISLKRDFDPEAGTIEAFPQEITRVLLNLISNGFYAVAQRDGANKNGFEPMLSASTRAREEAVEIRIRDNGTGIPAEVKEKMFNPFFTTKPAGEGTGLGLSMSHDIIVKQHGGTIDVDTAPGEFTEFIIRLPRKSNFSNRT
nr:GAF domain-containing protein [Bradyrhizobium commune]